MSWPFSSQALSPHSGSVLILCLLQFYQIASDGWRSKSCNYGNKLVNYLVNLPSGGTAFLGLEVLKGDKSFDAATMVEVTEKWMEQVPPAMGTDSPQTMFYRSRELTAQWPSR